jgi:hypothetical protein
MVCSFCGKRHDEVRRLVAGMSVDGSGKVFEDRLCCEGIATFMVIMAHEDREWFDKQVEEARAFRPDTV